MIVLQAVMIFGSFRICRILEA